MFVAHTCYCQLLPRSRKTFLLLNTFLVFIFYLRALYAFANMMDWLPSRQSVVKNNDDPVFFGVMIFYFITECLPAYTIISLIWRVPEKQARSFDTKGAQYSRGTRHDIESLAEDLSDDGLLDVAGEREFESGSSNALPVRKRTYA